MNARTPEQSGSGHGLIPALLALAVGVAVLLLANAAHANCAEPTSYEPTVSGNTVTICPRNWQERGCPDPTGMLREDVATGAVVRLADQCAEPQGAGAGGDDDPACYVDECVPPGQYRYGFAVPYECEPASCGTAYFFPVTVADALADCQRTVAGREPVAADGVPWSGDDQEICGYGGGEGGGCAVTAGAPTPLLVFGAQALALLAGLGLLGARRARRVRSRA